MGPEHRQRGLQLVGGGAGEGPLPLQLPGQLVLGGVKGAGQGVQLGDGAVRLTAAPLDLQAQSLHRRGHLFGQAFGQQEHHQDQERKGAQIEPPLLFQDGGGDVALAGHKVREGFVRGGGEQPSALGLYGPVLAGQLPVQDGLGLPEVGQTPLHPAVRAGGAAVREQDAAQLQKGQFHHDGVFPLDAGLHDEFRRAVRAHQLQLLHRNGVSRLLHPRDPGVTAVAGGGAVGVVRGIEEKGPARVLLVFRDPTGQRQLPLVVQAGVQFQIPPLAPIEALLIAQAPGQLAAQRGPRLIPEHQGHASIGHPLQPGGLAAEDGLIGASGVRSGPDPVRQARLIALAVEPHPIPGGLVLDVHCLFDLIPGRQGKQGHGPQPKRGKGRRQGDRQPPAEPPGLSSCHASHLLQPVSGLEHRLDLSARLP